MEESDEALMLAYRDGDAVAFERLHARHKGRLFRFVARSIRDEAIAGELYQEVWMRVIEARESYQPTAKFGTWLFTIAHHRMVDHWRRKGLSIVSLDGDGAPEPQAPEAADPLRRLEGRQALERFAAALAALPAAQREAFLLREEADLSLAQIAAVTGVDEEAAKSRLRYAVAKLKRALADD
jgi:RNA polymerase sigma-70 factor (ECF subfamily)